MRADSTGCPGDFYRSENVRRLQTSKEHEVIIGGTAAGQFQTHLKNSKLSNRLSAHKQTDFHLLSSHEIYPAEIIPFDYADVEVS